MRKPKNTKAVSQSVLEKQATQQKIEQREKAAADINNHLYTMLAGEEINVNGRYEVIRVPGGWVYSFPTGAACFVEYHEDGMPTWLAAANKAGFGDTDVITPELEDDDEDEIAE